MGAQVLEFERGVNYLPFFYKGIRVGNAVHWWYAINNRLPFLWPRHIQNALP